MKRIVVGVSILLMMIGLCTISCGKGDNSGAGMHSDNIVTSYSECVNASEEPVATVTLGDAYIVVTNSCVTYQYDGVRKLILRHENIEFNCCPGEINASAVVTDGLITIDEHESSPRCACFCLFNVDMELNNVEPGLYTIQISEPHLIEGNEQLKFTVDLSGTATGSHCVNRQSYPMY